MHAPHTVAATHQRDHKFKPGHPSYQDHSSEAMVYFHPTASKPEPSGPVLRSQRSQAAKRTVFAKKLPYGCPSCFPNGHPSTHQYVNDPVGSSSTAATNTVAKTTGSVLPQEQDDNSKYYRIAFYLLLFLATVTQQVPPLALVLSLSLDIIISVLTGRWLDFKLLLGGAVVVALLLMRTGIAVVTYVSLRVFGFGFAVVSCAIMKAVELFTCFARLCQRVAAACGVDV